MVAINVQQAQANLPEYLKRVAHGETIVITDADLPVAELRPPLPSAPARRVIGLGKGTVTIPPSFFEPMSDDELELWYGAGQ